MTVTVPSLNEYNTAMANPTGRTAGSGPVVIACGAIVRELRAVVDQHGVGDSLDVIYLPAPLHNRPERIVPEIERQLAKIAVDRPVFLGYADCGTGGLLDAFIEQSGRDITRLPGAHCYEFFSGAQRFAELHDEEIASFYLTDFLARHFDALVWQGMGMADHPELRDMYFGNYRRVVLLTQSNDPEVIALGRTAAERLELDFVHEHTGLAAFAEPVSVALKGVN